MIEGNDSLNESLKYVKVYNWARTLILSGVLKTDEKMLSEHMLQKKFGVSRQTVRNALDRLEEEKLIRRVRGSGTFISYVEAAGEKDKAHIGLIMSYFADYMFPEIYDGIESVMKEKGILIDVAVTKNKLNDETMYLEHFLNSNVSGLIVEGTRSSFPNPNQKLYLELEKRDIPIIFIHNHYSNLQCNSVEMADEKCSYELTRILIDNGHKKIGGIFKYDDMQGIERYKGFMECMSEKGLHINDECIKWYSTKDFDYQFSKKSLSGFLRKSGECTALIMYNDEIAEKFVEFAEDKGIRIPEDLSLVSFDNIRLSENVKLKLTSAIHPKFELGKRAARNLIRMMESYDREQNYSYRFPVSISNGNSVLDIT
ncbi:MAG: GntR family transcriptional regulator [Lachnospiraceae bacterium]|nr:GntR family transcriptional regulator [Lachnospiraceae bacterium]